MGTNKTPLEDLRNSDLKLYEKGASSIHHYSSEIPKAINFYYDYKQMNILSKIKLILTK